MKTSMIVAVFATLGLANASSQALLKMGTRSLPQRDQALGPVASLVHWAATNGWIVSGILLSWTCSVAYIWILSRLKLSAAASLYVAFATLASVLLGMALFHEGVSLRQGAGTLAILAGAYLVLSAK